MQINSQVVGHSLSPQGDELLSVVVTIPRFILAELNTHRMLSKNSASSRAIPFNKMVESVNNNPFIPIAWQKEHKGMQGSEYFTNNEFITLDNGEGYAGGASEYYKAVDLLNREWIESCKSAIKEAKRLNSLGITKQLCNRLLEPFMWHTVLVTGNVNNEGWLNFFDLRCPQYEGFEIENPPYFKSKKDCINNYEGFYADNTDLAWLKRNKGQAEIHMMALAEAIYDSWKESTPKQLKAGEWHIVFEDKIDDKQLENVTKFEQYPLLSTKNVYPNYEQEVKEKTAINMLRLTSNRVKISTAMCARTSYTVVGDEKEFGYDKQIALHDRMINQVPLHASPMEHCARAMTEGEYESYYKGFGSNKNHTGILENQGWCRNFKGFIQYRHILENEEI
jgi:thymidylate synthase ThyX